MAWTNPRTWVTGETVTAAQLNTHLRDNMVDLDARLDTYDAANLSARLATEEANVDALQSLTTNTSGAVGVGNQRLSDRLGSGVTNANTATSQFAAGVAADAVQDGRLTAIENIQSIGARRWKSTTTAIPNDSAILFDTAEGTPSGVTYSSGIFTVTASGVFNMSGNLYFSHPSGVARNYWLSIMSNTSDIRWGLNILQLPNLGSVGDFAFACSALNVPLAAGATVKLAAYSVTVGGGGADIAMGSAPTRRATNFAIQRIA
jgi:hypothetical protein